MKKIIFSAILILQALVTFAQKPTGISGKVIDSKNQKPLQNVIASIQNTNLTEVTDADGKFVFKSIAVG
ncbi:carboxypeptidase-like regulatory domain-containing protein, partial [Flavobacterium sp.]